MTKQLLKPQQLFKYQQKCVVHQVENPASMLWLDMGLGKTPITLTTIEHLIRTGEIKSALIIGPIRVITAVWEREARKWEHTKHLSFSLIRGNQEQRERAMFRKADIYLINYENLAWFSNQLMHYYLDKGQPLPYQMVVYDEISKMKNSQSQRFKGGTRFHNRGKPNETQIKFVGWRKIIQHFKYRTGLTGTPASNGYEDLFGQYFCIDNGERLGDYLSHFRDAYFMQGYKGFGYEVTNIGKQYIETKIHDITVKMDAEDYLEIPAVKYNEIWLHLDPKTQITYDQVEQDMFTKLDNGTEIEVFNRASVSNKCLQICNGAAYIEPGKPDYEPIHDIKLETLDDILEEAAGSPVLCAYSFKSDADRIMKRFKNLKPVNLTATPTGQIKKVLDDWEAGKIRLMIGHPACLHPSTEVLTERNGWTKLINVKTDDLVFDGVEFVTHEGCTYSGHKEVIDVFGITMTPDHKLLIDNKWVEAQHVGNSEEVRRKALYQYEGNESGVGEMLQMSNRVHNDSSECSEAQQGEEDILSTLYSGQVPQYDRNSNLENLVSHEAPSHGHTGQKLCCSWDRHLRTLAGLPQLLRGYARRLLGQSHHRADRREQGLQQRELYLDHSVRATGQQANEPTIHLSGRRHPSGRTVSSVRCQQNDVDNTTQPGNVSRGSSEGCSKLTIREESTTCEYSQKGSTKEHVYDLVNCGPRHRFLIRNQDGDVFISHNSMGHGIDGLQESGHILVWFGLTWSLELYYQMIGRLKRTGQTKPVIVHHLLMENTVDLAVLDAIRRKATNETGLKDAIQRYRDGVISKELTFI